MANWLRNDENRVMIGDSSFLEDLLKIYEKRTPNFVEIDVNIQILVIL